MPPLFVIGPDGKPALVNYRVRGTTYIVDRLFASLQKAMAAPDLREKLSAAGIEPTISKSPEEFGAFIKSQAEVREKVIKTVGIKID